ncbi:MAG: uroporphyrinogen decarboxylase family protein [Chloroflexota bacterium]
MNVRERVLAALTWQEPDRVPLTVYDWMLPRGESERLLRQGGVGLITRHPAHQARHRDVEFVSREYVEDGRRYVRRTIKTPVGEIYQVLEAEGAYDTSSWIKEHFIKGPDDYRVMEFYVKDPVYSDNYAVIRETERRLGNDGVCLVRVAKSPIQEMLYQMMGMERFGLDYYERRDLFDSLHETMARRYGEMYEFAAGCPSSLLQLGDNISSDVVGKERYRQYLMPQYARLRQILAGTGKIVSVHMDGRLRSLVELIGPSEFDVVEAMTPPPMGDVSIAEARRAWPDKALWINFTSSMHIEPSDVIAEHTRELLEQAGGKRGFAISITEDAPVAALERSLGVITQVLAEA